LRTGAEGLDMSCQEACYCRPSRASRLTRPIRRRASGVEPGLVGTGWLNVNGGRQNQACPCGMTEQASREARASDVPFMQHRTPFRQRNPPTP
jgi:hypothetical protein